MGMMSSGMGTALRDISLNLPTIQLPFIGGAMDHQSVSEIRLPLQSESLTSPSGAKQADTHQAQVVRILDGAGLGY
jgi:hypothetical protein